RPARRPRPRGGERVRGDGDPVRVVRRAAGRAAGGAGVLRRRAGAAARHRHRAQRVVVHGTDPARRADREERHHPAGFHAAAHARRGGAARRRDPGGRAGAAAPDPHDHAVHPVRPAAPRARPRRRKRAAATAGPRGDRRADVVHADHAVRGADAAGGDPGTQLYLVMKARRAVRTTILSLSALVALALTVEAQDAGVPRYLNDRGTGIPTSRFGTYIRRGELLGYLEVTAPSQRRRVLIGDRQWEFRPGLGLIRGFSWGTMTIRVNGEYNREAAHWDLGEFSIEYLKRLSGAAVENRGVRLPE